MKKLYPPKCLGASTDSSFCGQAPTHMTLCVSPWVVSCACYAGWLATKNHHCAASEQHRFITVLQASNQVSKHFCNNQGHPPGVPSRLHQEGEHLLAWLTLRMPAWAILGCRVATTDVAACRAAGLPHRVPAQSDKPANPQAREHASLVLADSLQRLHTISMPHGPCCVDGPMVTVDLIESQLCRSTSEACKPSGGL